MKETMMQHGDPGRLALGAELAAAYSRLDQAEAALFVYYHARLEATRREWRPTPDVDASWPLRLAVAAAHGALQDWNRRLYEARQENASGKEEDDDVARPE